MSYYFSKTLNNISFEEAKEKVIEKMKKEGFGVLTQINMKTTLKNKLDIDFKPYVILGACNAAFAYKALQAENKIGLMLPCNVIVEEKDNGVVEVSAVNPVASMISVKNDDLAGIAGEVQQRLQKVIDNL